MPKLKRDNGGSRQHQPESSKSPSFGFILEQAVKNTSPEDCCIVTYDSKRQLQTYYYQQSREYTY